MSPLQIKLLLNLHCSPDPLGDYPHHQRLAPAMKGAFHWFEREGLLRDGINHAAMVEVARGKAPMPDGYLLTVKGSEVVGRLMSVMVTP